MTERHPRLRLFHLVPVLAVLALSAWSFASPIGAAPDDDFHLTSTWCANETRTDLCEMGDEVGTRIVPPAVLYATCYAQDSQATPRCQDVELAKPTDPSVQTARGNFGGSYPPVYYAFMNLFASSDLQASALVMRFVNVLLFAGITALLYWLLPAMRRPTLLWGWTLSVVPLGVFLIASNNPSAWAVLGVGSAWLALLGYFETTGRTRIGLAVLYGVSVLMAAGSRVDSAIYVGLATVLVCVLTFRRERAWFLAAILPLAATIVAFVFFITSQQAAVAVTGLGDGSGGTDKLDGFGKLAYNLLSVQSLWAGVFGGWGLGWLDTTLPAIVAYGSLGAFVGVVFLGLGMVWWRKTLVLVVLGLVLWLLPVYVLTAGGNVVGENVQPRYLLPLIVVLAGMGVLAARGRWLRLGWVQSALVWVALAIANSIALHVNLRRYVTGIDQQGWNLDAGAEWWWTGFPLSPMAVWAIGSVAFAGLIALVLLEQRRMATANALPARDDDLVAA